MYQDVNKRSLIINYLPFPPKKDSILVNYKPINYDSFIIAESVGISRAPINHNSHELRNRSPLIHSCTLNCRSTFINMYLK